MSALFVSARRRLCVLESELYPRTRMSSTDAVVVVTAAVDEEVNGLRVHVVRATDTSSEQSHASMIRSNHYCDHKNASRMLYHSSARYR